jgi:hypothetical protein
MSNAQKDARSRMPDEAKPSLVPVEQNLDALQKWFGPKWTWIQMAEWIEARSRSSQMPRFAVNWSGEFLRMRREQEKMWKGE